MMDNFRHSSTLSSRCLYPGFYTHLSINTSHIYSLTHTHTGGEWARGVGVEEDFKGAALLQQMAAAWSTVVFWLLSLVIIFHSLQTSQLQFQHSVNLFFLPYDYSIVQLCAQCSTCSSYRFFFSYDLRTDPTACTCILTTAVQLRLLRKGPEISI